MSLIVEKVITETIIFDIYIQKMAKILKLDKCFYGNEKLEKICQIVQYLTSARPPRGISPPERLISFFQAPMFKN